ncbi:hypothetical protein MnTg02_02172 [bacterium MnTg02]|nr:hypothetical protein MnTg02_02172 [bacterium MnTg02]
MRRLTAERLILFLNDWRWDGLAIGCRSSILKSFELSTILRNKFVP